MVEAQARGHSPALTEITEARILLEHAMMHMDVTRANVTDKADLLELLGDELEAPTWVLFKGNVCTLHRRMFEATRNRLLLLYF